MEKFKCSGCHRSLEAQQFGKMKNGKQYKTCWTNCRSWRARGVRDCHKRCPTFGWQRRSCSHCKRPHEYPIMENTIRNKTILLNQLKRSN